MINLTGLDRIGRQVGLTRWRMLKWLRPTGLPKETFALVFLVCASVSDGFAVGCGPFQPGWFPELAAGRAGCRTAPLALGRSGSGARPQLEQQQESELCCSSCANHSLKVWFHLRAALTWSRVHDEWS